MCFVFEIAISASVNFIAVNNESCNHINCIVSIGDFSLLCYSVNCFVSNL